MHNDKILFHLIFRPNSPKLLIKTHRLFYARRPNIWSKRYIFTIFSSSLRITLSLSIVLSFFRSLSLGLSLLLCLYRSLTDARTHLISLPNLAKFDLTLNLYFFFSLCQHRQVLCRFSTNRLDLVDIRQIGTGSKCTRINGCKQLELLQHKIEYESSLFHLLGLHPLQSQNRSM